MEEVTLWDTATWRPLGPASSILAGLGGGGRLQPDGRTLAIAGAQGRVELLDVATRRKVRGAGGPPAAATSDQPALAAVLFSPDGSVIPAGSKALNHVTLWEDLEL